MKMKKRTRNPSQKLGVNRGQSQFVICVMFCEADVTNMSPNKNWVHTHELAMVHYLDTRHPTHTVASRP